MGSLMGLILPSILYLYLISPLPLADDSDSLYSTFKLQSSSSASASAANGKAEPLLRHRTRQGQQQPGEEGGEEDSALSAANATNPGLLEDSGNSGRREEKQDKAEASVRTPISWFGVLVPPGGSRPIIDPGGEFLCPWVGPV